MSADEIKTLRKRLELVEQDRGHWKTRAIAAERNQSLPGAEVWPSSVAKGQGFDKPGKLRWPGTVVYAFSKGAQRQVQFIVWDIDRTQYVLKTWVPVMLTEVKP